MPILSGALADPDDDELATGTARSVQARVTSCGVVCEDGAVPVHPAALWLSAWLRIPPTGPDLVSSPAEDGVPAFDETYQWTGPGGLKVTAGIIYERDPERGKRLDQRQADAVHEALVWLQRAKREIAAGVRCPGQRRYPPHCIHCQFAAEYYSASHCTRNPADCPCAPFHGEVI